MRKRSGRGFTLIELLVVIAIIAILAGIIFPVYFAVKRKARIAADTSNLKQVGTLLSQYLLDYRNQAPPALAVPTATPGVWNIVIDPDGRLVAPGDRVNKNFSYQEDGFGNVLYNYYGLGPDGYGVGPNVYYTGSPNTALGGVWPPVTGNPGGWDYYGIKKWSDFPMMRNTHRPKFTIVTWSPYQRTDAKNGGSPYDDGPIIVLRADGSEKVYSDQAALSYFAPDPTTGLAPFEHQTSR